MRLGMAIKKVQSIYNKIKNDPNVQKPVSYAMYHAWKWCDMHEQCRKDKE